jgi:hypothetical protein
MRTSTGKDWLGWGLAVLGLIVLGAGTAAAQTTTGTIRGYVRDQNGLALTGADVQARNVATGVARSATTNAEGAYVLPGLAPATYELTARHIGNAPQGRRVVVQIGATLMTDFALPTGAVEVAGVAIEAAAPTVELRTSEVATNISLQQIERLPTTSRNFLDLAALAPGVTVTEDRINADLNSGVTPRYISAGGASPNQVNVFVDGSSLKNDLTAGGIAGQDASRGNPFPRNAIQEYRVISQNFKAEYQKASSAIITATTKSGSNIWTGNVLFGYQNDGLVALDTFQIKDRNASPTTFRKPDYTRSLLGVSVGGPIQRDRLFFFGAYEGNYQNRANRVALTPPTGFAFLDTVNLTQYNGNITSPFRETLLFGKLNYAATPHSSVELSFSSRHETDVRDFGGTRSFQSAVDYINNVTLGTLKYNLFSGPWLNEAAVTFERYRRSPSPNTPGLPSRIYHYPGQDAQIGSNLSIQDFIQRRVGFRNDVTYSGFQAGGQHVFKGGVSVDFVAYDITKRNDETPKFEYADFVNTGCWCRDTGGLAFAYRSPFQLVYGTGIPGVNVNNTQLGAYLQDDWSPTSRLTLNLGLRWDFESHMLNTAYVTPQIVVDTLTRYNDSLPTPLDLSRYISTGSNRKPFYGGIQPRLGFSYALDEGNKTTIFGGFGIYYDRSIFDFSVDEIQKLTHPTYFVRFADPDSTPAAGQVAWNDSYLTADTTVLNALVTSVGQPEAFLLDNKMKPPKSKQWSLGVRRVLGTWVASVTYQGQRGTDLFTYNWANFGLNPNGSCCTSFNIGAHGFRNIIYSTNEGKTWYDALSLQFDRPYRRASANFGWGAGLVYTYAKRSLAGVDNLNDITSSFPGAFPNTIGIPKHADNGGNDERQRIVANWTMDVPYLFGIQFSGLLTLSSGARLDIGCPSRFCGPATYINGGFRPPVQNSIIPGGWAYQRVDVRLRKDFPRISGTHLGVTLDVFNVANTQNLGCFDVGFNSSTFSQATCTVSDPRRAQLGVEYNF